MEIIGKVVKLGNLMNGTSARGPWQKQELIIETDEQYPKTVCLNCWSDLASEAANLAPGQMVKAQINIESREFNGKWYTDVRVWHFESVIYEAASPLQFCLCCTVPFPPIMTLADAFPPPGPRSLHTPASHRPIRL